MKEGPRITHKCTNITTAVFRRKNRETEGRLPIKYSISISPENKQRKTGHLPIKYSSSISPENKQRKTGHLILKQDVCQSNS